jgi:hypothetical protein
VQLHYYSGVGSRNTPPAVCEVIEQVAANLRDRGYILRSGRADGADAAFEYAAGSKAHLYVPWGAFGSDRPLNGCPKVSVPNGYLLAEAMGMAADIHPAWDKVSGPGRLLHARNCFQVLGDNLDTPSDLLICYATPDKRSVKGGTRTAVELAKKFDIPIYNLYFPNEEEDLMDFLEMPYVA